MKIFKMKKRYYGDLEFMYKDLGLIKDNAVDPTKVFVSKKDQKLIEKTIAQKFKKQYPYVRKQKLESSVGLYLLNLAPSGKLETVLKDGFIVVLE
jgi:hypothetical protein